jgi:4'-phosphopantetheinyl transferase
MTEWRAPEGAFPYVAGAIHVWLALMPESGPPDPGALSDEERARAARFVFERDRAHYTFHHAALRGVLARYAGVPPRDVPLITRESGKPALACGPWRFNLSHSGPAALVAVAGGREVGVDIERLRPMPDALAIAGRFFAPAEFGALAARYGAEPEPAFFSCWTRKEAFIKATGEGLQRDLHSFEVPVDPAASGPWRINGWTVTGLPPVPGYACAVACEGDPLPVCTWTFSAP